MQKSAKLIIDILIVIAVTILSFALEELAVNQGWITLGDEARGVSSVLGGALAAVGVVLARGGTLADLGFKQPANWNKVPFQVIAILVAFLTAQAIAPLLVSSFTTLPEPDMSRYDAITGNVGAAIAMALILPLTASIPEELIYRGFLMGRLSEIFGRSTRGSVMTVLVQALFFGSVHFMWGIGGIIVTIIMGIVWGTAYLLCGRNLWVVILAHSTGHIVFAIQLYFGMSIIV